MVVPQHAPRTAQGLENQVRLQVRFNDGPAGWALVYGGLLDQHPALRLMSLRIVSAEHAEYTVLTHTPAGLAATLLGLQGLPAESIEVRGDSLFASIARGTALPASPPAPVRRPAVAPAPVPAAAAPVAPAARHGHLSLVTAQDEDLEPVRAAGVDHLGLAIGPFRRFSEVNRFIDALSTVHDVRSVKPRRFRRGTLYALVDYVGAAPFTAALATVRAFPLRVTASTEDRIEATLLEPEDQPLREIA